MRSVVRILLPLSIIVTLALLVFGVHPGAGVNPAVKVRRGDIKMSLGIWRRGGRRAIVE